MRFFRPVSRLALPALAALALTFSACGDDDKKDPAPSSDGTITWTHNGTTYTSTAYSSAILDTDGSVLVTGSSADLKNVVSLRLRSIGATGAGQYDLRQGSVLDDYSVGALTLDGTATTGTQYNTLYGPAASNGTATVAQYNQSGQRFSGTFSFVAGALPNTSATGTQSVTNGSFSFTKLR